MKAMYQNPVWIIRRPWNHQRLPQATTGSGRQAVVAAAIVCRRRLRSGPPAGGPAAVAAAASRSEPEYMG